MNPVDIQPMFFIRSCVCSPLRVLHWVNSVDRGSSWWPVLKCSGTTIGNVGNVAAEGRVLWDEPIPLIWGGGFQTNVLQLSITPFETLLEIRSAATYLLHISRV